MKNALLLSIFGALALTSCVTQPPVPTAKNVQLEPGTGGVITISPSDDPIAHQKAETLMQSNCQGRKFLITKEGEVKIGTTSDAATESTNKNAGFLDALSGIRNKNDSNSHSTTTDITQWQIVYKCK